MANQYPALRQLNEPITSEFLLRFIKKQSSGCWEWQRALAKSGYGVIRLPNGKVETVHRIAYSLWKGPIPKGLFVLHRCDNKKCANPEHLFAGTARDNIRDAFAKGFMPVGKKHPWNLRPELVRKGEQVPSAKLTRADVEAIRARKSKGESRTELAIIYGITPSHVTAICGKFCWKHV